jgi:hypothetical protein
MKYMISDAAKCSATKKTNDMQSPHNCILRHICYHHAEVHDAAKDYFSSVDGYGVVSTQKLIPLTGHSYVERHRTIPLQ